MFSFWSKKKTPETSPTDPIPSADSSSNDDGFTIVNRNQSPSQPPHNNLYPMMPPGYPPPMPGGMGYNRPAPIPPMQQQVVSYLQGVPFIMSASFCEENSFDHQRSELDHVYAIIQRSSSIEDDYDFQLERNILAQ